MAESMLIQIPPLSTTAQCEMLVADNKGEAWKTKVNNNFIYVPADNTSLIRQMLEKEGKNCLLEVVDCNGPEALQRYRDRISVVDLDACVGHNFDWSWGKQSQQAAIIKWLYRIAVAIIVIGIIILARRWYKNKNEQKPKKVQQNASISEEQWEEQP